MTVVTVASNVALAISHQVKCSMEMGMYLDLLVGEGKGHEK